jgi:non-specific serine/threonine protein kinase
MSADAASYAVLGLDVEELGIAVAAHWGLDVSVQHMIRRIPPGAPVHHPETDQDILRLTAACANDLLDATTLPAKLVTGAIGVIVRRYARPLGLSQQDMVDAMKAESAGAVESPAAAGPADVSTFTRAMAATPAAVQGVAS